VKVDLAGRVANVGLSNRRPLLPLFEAAVNSFDAIREAKERHGKIVLRVERGSTQRRTDDTQELGPILNFEVADTGIGFTKDNLTSFETTDTPWIQWDHGCIH